MFISCGVYIQLHNHILDHISIHFTIIYVVVTVDQRKVLHIFLLLSAGGTIKYGYVMPRYMFHYYVWYRDMLPENVNIIYMYIISASEWYTQIVIC